MTYGTSPPCGLPSVRSFSSPGQQTRRSSRRTIGYTRILSQVRGERRAVPHADERVLGQPGLQFGPLRTSVMSNSDYRNHPALARKLQAYLRWRNAQGSLPRHAGRPAPRARPHPQRTPATLGPPQTQGCLTNPVNVRGQRTRRRHAVLTPPERAKRRCNLLGKDALRPGVLDAGDPPRAITALDDLNPVMIASAAHLV